MQFCFDFRTVIGDDGKVRMETRFQSPHSPPESSRQFSPPPSAPNAPKPEKFSSPRNPTKSTGRFPRSPHIKLLIVLVCLIYLRALSILLFIAVILLSVPR